MTAVGLVQIVRTHFADDVGFLADAILGADGYLSVGARRLLAFVGAQESFAKARRMLLELCGLRVGEETIRKATHHAARRAAESRGDRDDADRFHDAEGVVEVLVDAGKVNTTEGWRDVKMAVFAKREEGESATPAEWAQRELPAPTCHVVVAAIEGAAEFTVRVRAEADRLGVATTADVTVLGDGAEWIWNLADAALPQAEGVLDVFHAVEHVADAAKAVWGESEAAPHLESGRAALLKEGKAGVEEWIGASHALLPPDASSEPLLKLAGYFAKHPTRLDYAGRLEAGRSIGSGQVEGAIKQMINLRLKRTGARWRREHVGPLVELVALSQSPEWPQLWAA